MELRVLNYFLTVAMEENITKAAKLLHVSQPTLSRQLMQLEEELGVKLFTRSNHSIILTDEGMLLKRRAQELVSLAEKTKQELSREDEQLSGEIVFGCGELRSVGFLSGLITSFQQQHPAVRYELYSGNADHIKDNIEKGTVDLGLLVEPVDISKYDFARIPLKEQWGILIHKDFALSKKQSVGPEDLTEIPLLMTKRTLVLNELANWFGRYYEKINIAATYNLTYNAAILAKDKFGAVICLDLDSTYEDLCFIPFSPKLEAGSVLAWKRNQISSATTTAFIEYAKKCIKQISEDTL